MPAGTGRRGEDERAGPLGMRGREPQCDDAAERDAQDDRAADVVLIERPHDLIDVRLHCPRVAQRERQDVEML